MTLLGLALTGIDATATACRWLADTLTAVVQTVRSYTEEE